MTNQEILTKAIEKAIAGGLEYGNGYEYCRRNFQRGENVNVCTDTPAFYLPKPDDYVKLIFNHDFAKALWGDKPMHEFALGESVASFNGEYTDYDFQIEDTFALTNWQYHLQQMVIADDPIKYLGEHI